ncbi:hypothetical protein ASD78_12980 [Lysobacter sp. Root667]|uniref:DUF695 domain-containing protein n=1 Tax=Lysobacter sp. Root667 TaxID=1736581 RepID=UPI0007013592|nr:DUF695 domain-containing protein [Lysobacter sp. Root667]KRA74389.1 hypothetical protein ASD78_12980 [Lysobacter sp. Root667]
MIPKPRYTLINTSIGDDPAVVTVNSALRRFEARGRFPWHLKISIDCESQGANGMPTAEEGDVLNHFEDSLSEPLLADQNAVFLARITARGQRLLLYRVHAPETANETLQAFCAPEPPREWDFVMEHDADWALAQPELRLLERDSRIN